MPRIPLATLLLAAACAAPGRGAVVVGSPSDAPGFPSQAKSGVVWAEAAFCTNHAEVFGQDLVRRAVLPVALRLGRRADDRLAQRLADDFDPHLYLADGTSLEWIPPEEAGGSNAALAERIAALGLRPGLLEDWERTEQRFLFFRLPEDVRVDGGELLVPYRGHWRSLGLAHSLLAFDLTDEQGTRTVHVGLATGRWTKRR